MLSHYLVKCERDFSTKFNSDFDYTFIFFQTPSYNARRFKTILQQKHKTMKGELDCSVDRVTVFSVQS